MKLLLLIVVILALTVNFGVCMHSKYYHSKSSLLLDSSHIENEVDCNGVFKAIAAKFEHFCSGSKQPIEKRVHFSDTTIVHVPLSEPTGIFWIKKKELLKLYQQKSQIFNDPESMEFKVVDMIAGIVEKSHLTYEKLYHFTVKLNGYELYLSQTKVQVDEETSVDFPDSEIFTKLQLNKEYFNAKVNDLLNLLKPSYEINEHLFKLMKSMGRTTRIDPNLFQRIYDEATKMNFYVQDLTTRIKNCRIDLYVHYLGDIRIQTNNLEFNMITLGTANEYLNEDVKRFQKVGTSMDKTLKVAMCIDFQKLNEVKATFCNLVSQALVRRPQ